MQSPKSRGGEGELSEVLSVLADEERRDVLLRLRERDGVLTTLYRLAADGPTPEPGITEFTAVRLHHVTLPKLAEAGLVNYDPDERMVEYRGSEAVERLLDRLDEPVL